MTATKIDESTFAQLLMEATLTSQGLANKVLKRENTPGPEAFLEFKNTRKFKLDTSSEYAETNLAEIAFAMEDRFLISTVMGFAEKITRQPTVYETIVHLLTENEGFGTPLAYLMGYQLLNDIFCEATLDSPLLRGLDMYHRKDKLLEGEFGMCFGSSIWIDAFRHPEHKVMDVSAFIAVGRTPGTIRTEDTGAVWDGPIVTWERTTVLRLDPKKFANICWVNDAE